MITRHARDQILVLLSFLLSEEESPVEACQTSPRTMDLDLNEPNDDMEDKGIDT
jgi:hypothetical protein